MKIMRICVMVLLIGTLTFASASNNEVIAVKQNCQKKVSLSLKNASLKNVLNYLAEASGVNIVIDEAVLAGNYKVSVSLEDILWVEALDVILRLNGLAYSLEKNRIWVSGRTKTKEKVHVTLPRPSSELNVKLQKKIDLEFSNASLRNVLSYISQTAKINIVLDERLYDDEGNSKVGNSTDRVTINLKEVSLVKALKIILRVKGLKYQAERNFVWVTSDKPPS